MLNYQVKTRFDFSGTPHITYDDNVRENTFIGKFSTGYDNGPKEIAVYGCLPTGINSYSVPNTEKMFVFKDFDNALYPGYGASEIESIIKSLHFMKIKSSLDPNSWIPNGTLEMNKEIHDHLQQVDVYTFAEQMARLILRPGWIDFVKSNPTAEYYWWTNKGSTNPDDNSLNKDGHLNFDPVLEGHPGSDVVAVDSLTRAEEKITGQPHRDVIIGYPQTPKNVTNYIVQKLIRDFSNNPEQIPTEITVVLVDDTEFSVESTKIPHAGFENKPLMRVSKYTAIIRDDKIKDLFLEKLENIFPIKYFRYLNENDNTWFPHMMELLTDDHYGPIISYD